MWLHVPLARPKFVEEGIWRWHIRLEGSAELCEQSGA